VIGLLWHWWCSTAQALWRRGRDWLDRLLRRRYRFVHVEGVMPNTLRPRTLYVLTEDQHPWVASMICPCGCDATLEMNLLTDERPCWSYFLDAKGYPSLEPSVWRKIDCRAHFFLRHGRIEWTADSGRS
jgi:hypothetical protein